MVLSQRTAQQVGLRAITNTLSAGVGRVGMRGLELGRVDTLEVDTLKVDNVPALIKNPPLTGLPDTRSENSFSPLALGLSTVIDLRQAGDAGRPPAAAGAGGHRTADAVPASCDGARCRQWRTPEVLHRRYRR